MPAVIPEVTEEATPEEVIRAAMETREAATQTLTVIREETETREAATQALMVIQEETGMETPEAMATVMVMATAMEAIIATILTER